MVLLGYSVICLTKTLHLAPGDTLMVKAGFDCKWKATLRYMMATHQLLQTRQKNKSSKESVLFPNKITTEQQSVVLVKRLLAISVSCITYLRGLFPESSYGTRYLDDLCLKILREDKSCLGSLQIVKWIQGCFDALEKKYLHIAVLAIYTNPKEPETVTELYQFKFKYKKDGPQMDIISNKMNFVNGVCSEEVKKASSLLIRKLYLLMQNLGPLPNDITLTMKLLYYNDVTPDDYQPPGFKEDGCPGNLLFDGDPVNLKVGSVSTGFHIMKVRVTTENKRMGTVESRLIQKNGPTEISHQGLDCDEEEEEGSPKSNPLPARADSSEHGEDKSDMHPGWKTEASSFCLQDTGGEEKTRIKETGKMCCSRASPQISCLNLAFSQEEVIGPKKKRKVSEPDKLLLEGRK
ncbi:HORMA domain-containing protein 2 isoform X2 [Apteryx mantelli]|uniref:HORMA domain-containing protein 2 isoform X2 n=1 Tax=Apteryx mantelli TaxID=2696672 RepID=A0A8B7JHQ5_9AVES|nr:PREDICTED: HORMA domain-containing protein 2 isoform X2 [Apteryx mantelli mantelli]XP_013810259.1 PREDICTED: HORMA domain-containing protein 2 isoform X2 [Apteryx mantelli mantelli]XP_013810260.1 PREDICTED: HORMA domain-containing protein 2 isoform X2 [Apteryx mantelli mantelli]